MTERDDRRSKKHTHKKKRRMGRWERRNEGQEEQRGEDQEYLSLADIQCVLFIIIPYHRY